ncbi:hypothetical protein SBA4_900029 [Candidatus Sulfopaludibacter sp. SbA4]|nr:hypothetical protein SBA4_900029 [Candidatus Sulfopaludibacter sp. SbA4]
MIHYLLDFFLKVCDFTLDGREKSFLVPVSTDAERPEDRVGRATAGGTGASHGQSRGGGAGDGTGEDHPVVGGGPGHNGDCGAPGGRAADGAALGKAFSASRDPGVGRRAPDGTARRHWA